MLAYTVNVCNDGFGVLEIVQSLTLQYTSHHREIAKMTSYINDSVNEYQKTNKAGMLHIVLHGARVVNNKMLSKTLKIQ